MKTEDLIESIFPQGDTRYNDFEAEKLVASFINEKDIIFLISLYAL